MGDKFIDLPDIRFEGLLQNGKRYLNEGDVIEWILACAEVARAHDIPVEVALYVDGMARAMLRAK